MPTDAILHVGRRYARLHALQCCRLCACKRIKVTRRSSPAVARALKTAAFTDLAAFVEGMQPNLLDFWALANQNRVKKLNLHPGVAP